MLIYILTRTFMVYTGHLEFLLCEIWGMIMGWKCISDVETNSCTILVAKPTGVIVRFDHEQSYRRITLKWAGKCMELVFSDMLWN
jgi:hypothetical protein